MTQPDLEKMFTSFGCIITSRILCDNVTGINILRFKDIGCIGYSSKGVGCSGLSKGVGFVRFDKREEAEMAIQKLNGMVPSGGIDPITVKFANNPAANNQKAAIQVGVSSFGSLCISSRNSYLSSCFSFSLDPQVAQAASALMPLALLNAASARRFPGPIHHHTAAAGRFRYSPLATATAPNAAASAADILNTTALLQAASAAGGNGFLSSALSSAANPANALTATTAGNSPGWCIFVYNLAPETEDATLWQIFGPFGAVLSVKVGRLNCRNGERKRDEMCYYDVQVIRDFQSGKCKGYGFVTMANYDESLAAITALHGTTLGNRVLQVSFKAQGQRK